MPSAQPEFGAAATPLRAEDAKMIAALLDEAAANLAALMGTTEAEKLGVRHFLPDELNGSAIILREHYSLPPAPTNG